MSPAVHYAAWAATVALGLLAFTGLVAVALEALYRLAQLVPVAFYRLAQLVYRRSSSWGCSCGYTAHVATFDELLADARRHGVERHPAQEARP